MRAARRWLGRVLVMLVVAGSIALLWGVIRGRPQDLPWTPLDLGDRVGLFTGRKLTALGGDFPRCRALLDAAGVRYTVLPPRRDSARCGYADGVRLIGGGSRQIAYRPAAPGVACPVAASLAMWEWNSVQPAAERLFRSRVVAIDHFGSYNCRRIYGRDNGSWSEHATADAVDIAGFRLADGTRITVARDWRGDGPKATFLHQVRNGACDLFATTLSPDYNAAHADHLHLDHARRGMAGWRACR